MFGNGVLTYTVHTRRPLKLILRGRHRSPMTSTSVVFVAVRGTTSEFRLTSVALSAVDAIQISRGTIPAFVFPQYLSNIVNGILVHLNGDGFVIVRPT